MAKVYLICGKICSGKSYYCKKLQKETNAVILSPDEATYDLLENVQGEFYDTFCVRLLEYMNKKAVEIVNAGANVIFERGLWTRDERESVKRFFNENNIETELHYVHVSEDKWYKQIAARNERVSAGEGGADFYVDEGLLNKVQSLFEEPAEDEVDVWHENC